MDDMPITLEELQRRFLLFLPQLIAAIVIFIVGLYLANLAAKLVDRALRRRQAGAEARQVVRQLTRWSLIVLVTITALQQVEFDLTAFVAGLGIVGFTIGFALKDVGENFVAGLLLLLQRPFELGDVVEIDDFVGRIVDVNLRATEMVTNDGQNVILPNGLVYTSPILNYTRSPLSRIKVEVGVGYDSDLEQVREVALQAIAGVPEVLEEPAPSLSFHTFGDSAIAFNLFYWVRVDETSQFQAANLAVPVIKQAFDAAGINIPFPIRTIYMAQEG